MDRYILQGYPNELQKKAIEKRIGILAGGMFPSKMIPCYKEDKPAVARIEFDNKKWYNHIMWCDETKEATLSNDVVLMKDLP